MQQLLEHTDRIPGMEVVFMADKDPAVQSWIRAHNNPAHLFGDMSIRLYKPTAIVNKCMKSVESLGKQSTEGLAITRRGDVDIYTCGFPCTPFSAKGMCRAWDDENSKPFFCTVDTLKSLRPRMFVLQNVRGILSNHGGGCSVRSSINSVVISCGLARPYLPATSACRNTVSGSTSLVCGKTLSSIPP